MRRRAGSGFFIGIIFLGLFVGPFIELLFTLLPIGIVGFLLYSIFSKKGTGRTYETTSSKIIKADKDSTVHHTTSDARVLSVSNADLNKIDKKLTSFFKKNINLPIIEGIALTTQSGKFTTADELYLTYKDEKVIKLVEFKKSYPAVYNKIMQLLLVFSKQKDAVINAEVNTESKEEDVFRNSTEYIDKIDKLNDAIPQEEITNGLYQTCDLLKKIDLLKETKNDETKVKKLYDYYLPILINVLENYKKLNDAPVHGDEFKDCEAQLIKTIVLINEALKTICSNMQEDDYMNLNADISTLQSLLQKDGYGENPFKGGK